MALTLSDNVYIDPRGDRDTVHELVQSALRMQPSHPFLKPAPDYHGQSLAGEVGMAIFALGRFIDYWIERGAPVEEYEPWMQAYINLVDRYEDREPRALAELRALEGAVSQTERDRLREVGPDWLPDGEKLRLLRLR